MRLTGRARLPFVIIGIAVLIAGIVWATRVASAQPALAASPLSASTLSASVPAVAAARPGAAYTSSGRQIAGSSPAVSYPVWCCSGGNPLGLTVTGEATARGTGQAARILAIARAVADARGQAKAAASAAGITLGRIINMQVSAPYYPYPLPMGAATGSSVRGAPGMSGAPASGAPGTSATSGAGAGAAVCPGMSPCPYWPGISASATVTITWAIR